MRQIIATLMLFTRLPLWRLKQFSLSKEHYREAITYWPVAGWLTGGVMALIFYIGYRLFNAEIAVLLAILSRVLLTGALHEDGLADFFDGFGAGGDCARILAIMKDSHIGTYGVLALILYFLFLYQGILCLPESKGVLFSGESWQISFRSGSGSGLYLYDSAVCTLLFVADPLCKFIASTVNLVLPYVRSDKESKSGFVYKKPTVISFIIGATFGLAPLLLLVSYKLWLAMVFPVATLIILTMLMKRKIGGYTGDCCGALFLICELSFYLGAVIMIYLL